MAGGGGTTPYAPLCWGRASFWAGFSSFWCRGLPPGGGGGALCPYGQRSASGSEGVRAAVPALAPRGDRWWRDVAAAGMTDEVPPPPSPRCRWHRQRRCHGTVVTPPLSWHCRDTAAVSDVPVVAPRCRCDAAAGRPRDATAAVTALPRSPTRVDEGTNPPRAPFIPPRGRGYALGGGARRRVGVVAMHCRRGLSAVGGVW